MYAVYGSVEGSQARLVRLPNLDSRKQKQSIGGEIMLVIGYIKENSKEIIPPSIYARTSANLSTKI